MNFGNSLREKTYNHALKSSPVDWVEARNPTCRTDVNNYDDFILQRNYKMSEQRSNILAENSNPCLMQDSIVNTSSISVIGE
jgi:hypothetical protein